MKKFRDAVQANPELKNRPELDALRKALLKEPLEFFRKLRDQLQADHDTRPRLGKARRGELRPGVTTAEIGSIPDAIRSYTESISHPRATGARQPHRHRVPARPGREPLQPRHPAERHGPVRPRRWSRTGRRWRSSERLVRDNPTVTEFQGDLAGSHNNIGTC